MNTVFFYVTLAHPRKTEIHPRSSTHTVFRNSAFLVGRLTPWLAAVCTSAVYSILSLNQYRRLATPSWDLAIFRQAVASWSQLRLPVIDAKGLGTPQLADHFSPILAVLGPIYKIFPFAQTLLIAQALLVGLSVVPVMQLAIERLGLNDGVVMATAYALSWPLQQMIAADFHEVAFAVPLVAIASCRIVQQRWLAAALWSLPLLLVKEDLGLTVAVFALLIFRGRRRTAIVLLVGSLTATVVTMCVIMPALGGSYQYARQIHVFQDTPDGSTFIHGLLALVWPIQKLTTLGWLLIPVAGIALRSPVMWLAAPTLLWRFEADNPAYWGTHWHYNGILAPITFVAAIQVLGLWRSSKRSSLRSFSIRLPAAVAAAACALSLSLPVGTLRMSATWQHSKHAASVRAAASAVPNGSWVEANLTVLSPLAGRTRVSFVGTTPSKSSTAPEWIVLDLLSWRSASDSQLTAWAGRAHEGHTYRIIFLHDQVAVLRQTQGKGPTA